MATLQPQQIPVKFQGGIETKMDSKAVPSARLLVLENGVFTKAISIKKRNGYQEYSRLIETTDGTTQPQYANPKRLAVRDENELLLFNNKRCYSHQTGDADQWTDVGQVYSVIGNDRAVVHTGTEQTVPDHASNGGVTAYAWEDSRGGVYYTVTDESSGRVHVSARSIYVTDGASPRCVAVGPNIHIYFAVPSLNRVMVMVVDPSNPSRVATAQTIISDLNTNAVFDACATTRTGTPAAIVWHEAGTNNFRLGYVDSSGALGTPANGHPSVVRSSDLIAHQDLRTDTPIAVAYLYVDGADGDHLAVAAVNTRSTRTAVVFHFSGGEGSTPIGNSITIEAWVQVSFTGAVSRCAVAITSTTIQSIFEDANDAVASNRIVKIRSFALDEVPVSALTVTIVDNYDIRSLTMASRAFVVDDEVFAYFAHDTTYFNLFVALRVTSPVNDTDGNPRFACVSRQSPGAAAGIAASAQLPSVHVADNVAMVCLPYKTRLASADNDKFGETGLRSATLDFDHDNSHQYAQLGRGLYLAGACPQHYDGLRWCEQGFHVGPELDDPTALIDYGGAIANGTYEYVAWYEYTDTQGEVHRGPTSVGMSITLADDEGGAQDGVQLVIPTYRFTNKENVRICVARSLNGDATRFFRVTSLDPTTAGNDNGYLANDITVDSVTFTDVMIDATLRKQEPLYTNGGILSNDPTELGNVIAVSKNRLFFSDSSDPNGIRYSQEIAEGYGVEIAPELTMKVNPNGGDIQALYAMDEFVIVFKTSAIYAFNGAGPLPNGDIVNGTFSGVEKISSDVGCTNPSSIVETPLGLMFQSNKGIYLLGRDRSVQYVGSSAERFNAQTITRATVMPDRSQVVFLTSDGTTLLYDFLFGQWSTFTNHLGYDSVVAGGVYHYLRTDDRVFAETIGSYSDAGVRIRLRFETAWIHIWDHLTGLQRFWRLILLGTWGSPHQLGVQFRTDYDESGWNDPCWLDATGETDSSGWITGEGANTIGEDPITGDAYGDGLYGDGVYGGTNPDIYLWRIGLHCQGKSIQFRFEDFEKAGYAGATFELTEMLITGGVMKPDDRPFTAARSG